MSVPILVVDAFSDRPFAGNPAAVCILEQPREAAWMQAVAAELNLSETAFLTREGEAWRLRWFTPAVEVDLCGHATLASSHVLWAQGHLAADAPAVFETRSGRLTATRGDGGWIRLDLPADPPVRTGAPEALLAALEGDWPVAVGRARMAYLAELADERTVRGLAPNLERIRDLDGEGLIVTARAEPDAEYDIVSRFFAPRMGIDEDPVTGSAHCILGPYWAQILDRESLVAYQASARGGTLRVQLAGDRVGLEGQAVTVWRGELLA